MKSWIASLRLVVVSWLICVAGYSTLILGFAQIVTPHTANGSLIKGRDGNIVGSLLIAQGFTHSMYFWPRPSAVSYNAAGAGGSNKSPTSTQLTERALQWIEQHGASASKPLPAELAAASGGGLDPHITEDAARYQVDRVASARGIPYSQLEAMVTSLSFSPGNALTPVRLVNVLELNLALNSLKTE
jgi:potassium-transporting ATPase KdpC subunit